MLKKNISIIGMGYVGLTIAVVLAERGFKVFGVEAKNEILHKLKSGKAHFYEKGLDLLIKKHIGVNLHINSEITDEEIDAFIISVGTPLKGDSKKPDMSHIINASKQVSNHLQEGQIVILRSTVPVGTTENVVLPILQEKCPNVLLAFCPERTVEGKALEELKTLAQVIGGLNEESVERAMDIFRKVTYTTIEVSSLGAAEMIKLLDNSHRDSKFAFANEVALICKTLGLDAREIIEAANQGYPRNEIALPGYVAGPCLIKDPHILVERSRQAGYNPKLIQSVRDLNEYLPIHTYDRVMNYFKEENIKLHSAKIFISGLAFKGFPETDDVRDSSTLVLLEKLKISGAKQIYGHDFIVKDEIIQSLGVSPCNINRGFEKADCVLIMNNHPSYQNYDVEKLVRSMKKGGLLFDSWNIFESEVIASINCVHYESIGKHLPLEKNS